MGDLAPNTNFIASGGRDGKVNIWNLVEGRHLEEIDAESPVNVVLFASKLFWLVIGTEDGIRIYDLPNKSFIDRYEASSLDNKKRVEAKIDGTQNDILDDRFDVRGYPALFFMNSEGKVESYNGGRTLDDMLKYIEEHKTPVSEDILKSASSAKEL